MTIPQPSSPARRRCRRLAKMRDPRLNPRLGPRRATRPGGEIHPLIRALPVSASCPSRSTWCGARSASQGQFRKWARLARPAATPQLVALELQTHRRHHAPEASPHRGAPRGAEPAARAPSPTAARTKAARPSQERRAHRGRATDARILRACTLWCAETPVGEAHEFRAARKEAVRDPKAHARAGAGMGQGKREEAQQHTGREQLRQHRPHRPLCTTLSFPFSLLRFSSRATSQLILQHAPCNQNNG